MRQVRRAADPRRGEQGGAGAQRKLLVKVLVGIWAGVMLVGLSASSGEGGSRATAGSSCGRSACAGRAGRGEAVTLTLRRSTPPRQFVRRALKSPDSAEFPVATDPSYRVMKGPDGSYTVHGEVSAQNALGVHLNQAPGCGSMVTRGAAADRRGRRHAVQPRVSRISRERARLVRASFRG